MAVSKNHFKQLQGDPSLTLKVFRPLLILLVAVITTFIIQATAPSAAVKPDSPALVNVNVINIKPQLFTPSYVAYGSVIAKNSLTLTAQVEGRLNHLSSNVIEGGVLNIGDSVYGQESADLRALVTQRRAEINIAKAQLSLELGQQRIAEKDYQMMQADFNEKEWQLDLELLLRKPQLSQAQAQLNMANNALQIAERDLSRSQWVSNKRYVVAAKSVSEGDYLAKGDLIAKLVDPQTLRVPIFLPRELAAKVTIGQNISLFQPDTQRTVAAKISHVLPVLTSNIQLQKVFAEYQVSRDGTAPLIIGDFVEATLLFPAITNTLNVPLSAIDNQHIWLVSANNTLLKKPVTLVHQDKHFAVIINNLSQGEQIISNKMHDPQANMSVNIVERL